MFRRTATIRATGGCRSSWPGKAMRRPGRRRRGRRTEMGRGAGEAMVRAARPVAEMPARRADDRPLFEAIGRFLEEHRLDYSPANYLLAYTLITRKNAAA